MDHYNDNMVEHLENFEAIIEWYSDQYIYDISSCIDYHDH